MCPHDKHVPRPGCKSPRFHPPQPLVQAGPDELRRSAPFGQNIIFHGLFFQNHHFPLSLARLLQSIPRLFLQPRGLSLSHLFGLCNAHGHGLHVLAVPCVVLHGGPPSPLQLVLSPPQLVSQPLRRCAHVLHARLVQPELVPRLEVCRFELFDLVTLGSHLRFETLVLRFKLPFDRVPPIRLLSELVPNRLALGLPCCLHFSQLPSGPLKRFLEFILASNLTSELVLKVLPLVVQPPQHGFIGCRVAPVLLKYADLLPSALQLILCHIQFVLKAADPSSFFSRFSSRRLFLLPSHCDVLHCVSELGLESCDLTL